MSDSHHSQIDPTLSTSMKKFGAVLPVATLIFLCGCPTTRPQFQPERMTVQGMYIHAQSKIAMPESIAGFKRDAIIRYDADGVDVSAGYNAITSSSLIAATVYVYPAPSLVSIGSPPDVVAEARANLAKREFEHRKYEIEHVHPGAVLIDQHDTVHTEDGQSYAGKTAVYEYEDTFAGSRRPLRSELDVFCYVGGRWAIEYRFTHPKAGNADKEIQEFIEEWHWYESDK